MAGWRLSSRKSPAPQKVTTGRFEIERDGKVAYLEYTMTGSVLGTDPYRGPGRIAWPGSGVFSGGDRAPVRAQERIEG